MLIFVVSAKSTRAPGAQQKRLAAYLVLLNSSTGDFTVPPSVAVRAGFSSATFNVSAAVTIASPETATITATLGTLKVSAQVSAIVVVHGIDVVSVATDKGAYKFGDFVTVTYTVQNSSAHDSGPVTNGVAGWFIPGYTNFITLRNLASLSPGGRATDSVKLQLPSAGPAGTYTVRVTGDYYDAVAVESGNPVNVGQASFTVGP